MFTKKQYELLIEIYERYNCSEDSPDIDTIVEDINYLLSLVGIDSAMYSVIKTDHENQV